MISRDSQPPVNLRRILLVEDDRDIQIVVRMALEDLEGYEVEICSSGQEALKQGPTFAPQLILLDVMMPDLDGVSTLVELRRLPETVATPVIFMTAKAQPEEIAEYRQLGAADVIVKPFDPLKLASTIERIWRRHQRQAAAVSEGSH